MKATYRDLVEAECVGVTQDGGKCHRQRSGFPSGDRIVEKMLHRRMARHGISGLIEWFYDSAELREDLALYGVDAPWGRQPKIQAERAAS